MRAIQRDPDPEPELELDSGESSSLGRALTHGLGLPIAALRASMEALSVELAQRDPRAPRLEGVLQEVALIGRNVQDLLDYTRPPEPHCLRCTFEEILIGAKAGMEEGRRSRIDMAFFEPKIVLEIDGPLVARNLRRVIDNSFEAGAGRVLVSAKLVGRERLEVSVVDDGPRDFDPRPCRRSFQTTKPNHLGLGLSIVERDLALVRGSLEITRSPMRYTRVVLTIPGQSARATRGTR